MSLDGGKRRAVHPSPWSGGVLVGVLVGYVVFYVSWQLFDWIPGDRAVVGGILQNPTAAIAVVLAWKASCRRTGSDHFALAWRLIAVGILGQIAGSVATIGYALAGQAPYPSLADPLFLLSTRACSPGFC